MVFFNWEALQIGTRYYLFNEALTNHHPFSISKPLGCCLLGLSFLRCLWAMEDVDEIAV